MDVRQYADDNAAGFFAALRPWLAIPSISALAIAPGLQAAR
jgi:hypothetical protein